MDRNKSGQQIFTKKLRVFATSLASANKHQPKQSHIQNYLLIWADPHADQEDEDCLNTLTRLRTVVNDVILQSNSQSQ
ncbi:unnamed protein product [Rotaria socialis]|uniref:Uncharacterized protein n=2 Tax=Rotaria socialis TaxID=392032 RepID=A0A818ICU9_9BILA|nr:unnamed protein product [Rotaria socialis]